MRFRLFFLLIPLLLTNCKTVDAALDCHAICQRYADCYNSTYDTSACETKCRAHAADDVDYNRQADTCHACLGERDCASTVFACGTECISIVP